ncbi:MAG: ATP-binding protein [Ignavibacteriales bacterium]
MSIPIIKIRIKHEEDTVFARQRARQISELLGFESREQTAIATSVSELVRNVFNYAGGGSVEFYIEEKSFPQIFSIRITDEGPGINDLDAILEGRYKSATGMGLGIIGTRRLMDNFFIDTEAGKGTTVIIGKIIPLDKSGITSQLVSKISEELARQGTKNPMEEIQQQNQELLVTLEEIRKRQDELLKLNKELEETNRGVIALYAELDEKAEHLKRMNDVKVRFLSNMSHEFKTPLNSILALSRLLLDQIDGELNDEQKKQIVFIKKSAEDLSELVSDLLDIAKVESGKITVKPVEFAVSDVFAALRGMMRPLLVNSNVNLIFEEPKEISLIYNDEGKISQVLRNFISNALKFTLKGEVRVSAALSEDKKNIIFSVADTGIGIAYSDQEIIFEEFGQVDSELQKKAKGTGLGLPLSKRLAELLRGTVHVESNLGMGSVFYASFPIQYESDDVHIEKTVTGTESIEEEKTVLVIGDNEATVLTYGNYLMGTGFKVVPAKNLEEASKFLKIRKPFAIILDILLSGEDTWKLLTELKSNVNTHHIPVFVASVFDEQKQGFALGADDYCVKPVEREWLLRKLQGLSKVRQIERILIIDDEEISRYILKEILPQNQYQIIEASNGSTGIQKAIEYKPDLIFLDIIMPDQTGFEVLGKLKANSVTKDIPVIISTSKDITEEERGMLNQSASAILSKQSLSRSKVSSEIKEALIKAVKERKGK